MQRSQGPVVDVPVPAGTPGASTASPAQSPGRPGSGMPGPAGPGTGGGTGSPGGGAPGGTFPGAVRVAPPASGALPPAPVVVPAIPPHPGPYRIQRRSLADMANEQLRRGKPKDPLAEGMEGAAIDDCLHEPSKAPMMGGLLAAPGLAAKALSGRCPK
ncbi:MAG: hypothetical protein ABIR26_11820 [Ramlibacter sp.]